MHKDEYIDDLIVTGEYKGADTINTPLNTYMLTLLSQESVDYNNQHSSYGYTDWALNTPKDLTTELKEKIASGRAEINESWSIKKVENTLYIAMYDPEKGDSNPDPEVNSYISFTAD